MVVVDDSIVRGTTSRKIVHDDPRGRRARGAPAHQLAADDRPCYYGIDTPTREELIASSHDVDEIREFISADSLALPERARACTRSSAATQRRLLRRLLHRRYPVPLDEEHAGAAAPPVRGARPARAPLTARRFAAWRASGSRASGRAEPPRRERPRAVPAALRRTTVSRDPAAGPSSGGRACSAGRGSRGAALRALDDELGDGRDVAQLDQVAGEQEVPVVLRGSRPAAARCASRARARRRSLRTMPT